MELTGTVKLIGNNQEVGSKGFKKRQILITTSEQYPQDIPVDFVQDKTAILDQYKVGQNVTIGINLRGSEWQGKHYASIQGWKINAAQGIQENKHFETTNAGVGDSGDLPF